MEGLGVRGVFGSRFPDITRSLLLTLSWRGDWLAGLRRAKNGLQKAPNPFPAASSHRF